MLILYIKICFCALWVLFERCNSEQGAVSTPGAQIGGARSIVKVAMHDLSLIY